MEVTNELDARKSERLEKETEGRQKVRKEGTDKVKARGRGKREQSKQSREYITITGFNRMYLTKLYMAAMQLVPINTDQIISNIPYCAEK